MWLSGRSSRRVGRVFEAHHPGGIGGPRRLDPPYIVISESLVSPRGLTRSSKQGTEKITRRRGGAEEDEEGCLSPRLRVRLPLPYGWAAAPPPYGGPTRSPGSLAGHWPGGAGRTGRATQ